MFLMDYEKEKGWIDPRIVPYGPLSLDPSAMVLHYGQEIFEGLKAYRWTDGTIALFRPDKNIERWNRSARRLCMAETDPEIFMQGMKALILLDRDWIPVSKGTSLYIRPTMIATEAALGVKPSSRYLFFIILGPVGPYYPEGFSPTRIYVTKSYVRAAKGGVGETKTGGNYAASLFAASKAQEMGYTQVLWLDAAEHKYVEEVGTSNIFFLIRDELITPPLAGTILPGVTRDSVIHLAENWGIKVTERPITIDEVLKTAQNGRLEGDVCHRHGGGDFPGGRNRFPGAGYPRGRRKTGPLAQRLYDEITGIQYGVKKDPFGWVVKIA